MAQKKKGGAAPKAKRVPGGKKARVARRLSPSEIARLPKPISNYEELARKTGEAWPRVRDSVRVHGLTPAKLLSLLRRAEKAQTRESRIEVAARARMQEARDARLLADAEAYRALLDVRATAEAAARRDPRVRDSLGFLLGAFERGPRAAGEPPPEAPPPS